MRTEPIETLRHDDGSVEFTKLPPVTLLDAFELDHLALSLIREHGYRFVEPIEISTADVYARGYLRWAYLRSRYLVHLKWWAALRWLRDRGMIRTSVPRGCPTRFRDLRLGREKR